MDKIKGLPAIPHEQGVVKGEGVICKKEKEVVSSDDSILSYEDITFLEQDR